MPQTHAILVPQATGVIKVQEKMGPHSAQAIDSRTSEAKRLGTQQGLDSSFEAGSLPKQAPKLPTLITRLEWEMPGNGRCAQQGSFMPL